MSDDRITLIPECPTFVPDRQRLEHARARFSELAAGADKVTVEVRDAVEFFDCGANFERVRCPACNAELPLDWWQDRMSSDYREGFLLAEYATPCCGRHATLHELRYERAQGFGRASVSAMNPGIVELDRRHVAELEGILGTRLRVIYQHI